MVIIGAKGLAKEILTALTWNDFNKENYFFFDNVNKDTPDKLFGRFLVIKSWEELAIYFKENGSEFILGVGGSKTRHDLAYKVSDLGGTLHSFISKQALLGEYGNVLGEGTCILSNAIITCDVTIGKGTLINKAAIISHDAQIGEYCEISPGARIMGRTKIGNYTEVGTGAIVLPDITLGDNCKIGAGAVVTRNYPENSIVAGVPVKLIKMNEDVVHE